MRPDFYSWLIYGSLAAAVAALSLACPAISLAQDASCDMVMDALSRSLLTPSHNYTTMKIAALGDKITVGEQINTGAALYAKGDARWQKIPMTPQDQQRDIEEKRKTAKLSCHFLRDEAADGVSSSLYSYHEDGDGGIVDGKIWIAKSSGLPTHQVMDMEGMHAETRMVYGAQTPPPTN